MMKVKNIRPVAVDVPLPLGGQATVEAGGVLSTSEAHGQSLLEQPINWEPAAKPAPAAAAKGDAD